MNVQYLAGIISLLTGYYQDTYSTIKNDFPNEIWVCTYLNIIQCDPVKAFYYHYIVCAHS
jgi:hypothetical protein